MAISTQLSVSPLSVNGLDSPSRRHRVAEWIHAENKTRLYAACERSGHTGLRIRGLKAKGWEEMLRAGGNPEKAGVAALTSDRSLQNKVHNSRHRWALLMTKGFIQQGGLYIFMSPTEVHRDIGRKYKRPRKRNL